MHASLAAKTLIAAAALTLAAGAAASAEEKPMQRTVTVSAAGQVSAEPDLARISTGIVTEGKAARDALARNSETMKALIAGLKSSGIEAKDIQTSSFHVEPRYTSPREGQAAAIDGYRVVNQVQVTARNLAKLGEVLDALVGLGANQMGGLAFEVSKAESLKDEARKEAMANALRRAKLLASAGGAEVGEVIAISEDVSDGGPRPLAMAHTAMAEAVPIERGTETLVARVTVTWALK